MPRSLILTATICLFSALLETPINAANKFWIDSAGGSFTTSSNWDNGVPGAADSAIFYLQDSGTVTFGSDRTTGDLLVGWSTPSFAIVDFDLNGHTWTVHSPYLGNYSESVGAVEAYVTIVDGTLQATNGFTLWDASELTVKNGGRVVSPSITVNSNNGGKSKIYVQSGGLLSAGLIGFYAYGGGSLDISGGVVNSGTAFIAHDADPCGGCNISSEASISSGFWSNSGLITVGYDNDFHPGQGELSITGGVVNTGSLTINAAGTLNHTNGTLAINGGTYTQTSDGLFISGNTSTANPSFQLLNGATNATNSVQGVVVGSLANRKGDLVVNSDSKLNNTGSGILGTYGSVTVRRGYGYLGLNEGTAGTATIGAGSEWTNSAQLYVGVEGTGTLNVEAGGKVTNTYGNLAYGSLSNGTATVTGAGSEWNNSGALEIGYRGTGTLNVEAGGKVSSTEGYLGSNAGSNGTATVTGAGSQWNNSSFLRVGNYGSGILNIEDGGKVTSVTGIVGYGPGSTGAATVTGVNSEWANTNTVVGSFGNGTLNLLAGGKVSNLSAYLGASAGSNGTATVTGSGAEWNNSTDLYIGGYESANGGVGSLSITDSGLVSVGGLTKIWNGDLVTVDGGTFESGSLDRSLGTFNHFDGVVKINGGTYTQAAGGLFVSGNTPTANPSFQMLGGATNATNSVQGVVVGTLSDEKGELVVSDGSTIENTGSGSLGTYGSENVDRGFAYLGLNAGSSGNVTVAGTGSQWTNPRDLFVGRRGAGTLTIEAGGKVTDAYSYLGYHTGSMGTATVTGTGSEWYSTGSLYIGGSGSGSGGTGLLTVNNGGQVSAGNITIWSTGTLAGDGGTLLGNVTNEGTIAPGSSAGQLTIDGDLTQQATGTLEIELGGTNAGSQFDQLVVTGNLSLGGTLAVSLVDGFTPSAGNAFDILDWTTVAGAFDSIMLPELIGRLAWNVSQIYTVGVISVGLAGDFDGDGDVNGRDFLEWQRNPSAGSLADWQANYGMNSIVSALGIPPAAEAASPVPEPQSLIFCLFFLPAMASGRRLI